MKTFFTADWHLGHENVIKFCERPFANADEMDSAIIDETNKLVGKHDRLIIIGDFTSASTQMTHDYIHRIKCKNIILTFGNHEIRNRVKNFVKTYDIFEVKHPHIVCCHYPMAVWNKLHRGSYHLYGHSHGQAEEYLDKVFPDRRSMDVGVDNICKLYGTYSPISKDQVIERLGSRKGFWFDGKKD